MSKSFQRAATIAFIFCLGVDRFYSRLPAGARSAGPGPGSTEALSDPAIFNASSKNIVGVSDKVRCMAAHQVARLLENPGKTLQELRGDRVRVGSQKRPAPLEFQPSVAAAIHDGWAPGRPYPIFLFPSGNRFIQKYGDSVGALDARPLRARAAYVMGFSLNYAHVQTVQIFVGPNGSLHSMEPYFGNPLEEVRGTLDGEPWDIWHPMDDAAYERVFKRWGKSFVDGDIFRSFALYPLDSFKLDGIRYERQPTGLIVRWIDYGYAFERNCLDNDGSIVRYLQARRGSFMEHSRDLIEAVTALSDETILEIAENVFGVETAWFLEQRFGGDHALELPVARRQALGRDLGLLKNRFLTIATSRRDLFRSAFAASLGLASRKSQPRGCLCTLEKRSA